ncbi:unnamed protein product, partial [Nesidiocoris tenuis]
VIPELVANGPKRTIIVRHQVRMSLPVRLLSVVDVLLRVPPLFFIDELFRLGLGLPQGHGGLQSPTGQENLIADIKSQAAKPVYQYDAQFYKFFFFAFIQIPSRIPSKISLPRSECRVRGSAGHIRPGQEAPASCLHVRPIHRNHFRLLLGKRDDDQERHGGIGPGQVVDFRDVSPAQLPGPRLWTDGRHGNGMDPPERPVRPAHFLDPASPRTSARSPNAVRLRTGQFTHSLQIAAHFRLRYVDGCSWNDFDHILRMPLHWMLLPMGSSHGRRR